MRFISYCVACFFLLVSTGCSAWAFGGYEHSGLRVWKAYTFEGECKYNNQKWTGEAFTVEQWKSVKFDSGVTCLQLELSRPDDRWSPETAGPFHNYTSSFANLFILSNDTPPFDVTLTDGEAAPVSVWMMPTGYLYDLTDESKLRERLQERASRFKGEIKVRRGWNSRLYINFDIASVPAENDSSMAIKGELLTHRHFGVVTWQSNAKGIRSRFNNSWIETTWP